jgi:hypothetical protein
LKDAINKGRIEFLEVKKRGGNTQIVFVWNMLYLWSELKDSIHKGIIKCLELKKKKKKGGGGTIHHICCPGM